MHLRIPFVDVYIPNESKKMFARLASCGIKSMHPIFKTEMFIYQSRATLGPVYTRSDPNESVSKL